MEAFQKALVREIFQGGGGGNGTVRREDHFAQNQDG